MPLNVVLPIRRYTSSITVVDDLTLVVPVDAEGTPLLVPTDARLVPRLDRPSAVLGAAVAASRVSGTTVTTLATKLVSGWTVATAGVANVLLVITTASVAVVDVSTLTVGARRIDPSHRHVHWCRRHRRHSVHRFAYPRGNDDRGRMRVTTGSATTGIVTGTTVTLPSIAALPLLLGAMPGVHVNAPSLSLMAVYFT